MNDNPAQDPQSNNSYVDDYQPPKNMSANTVGGDSNVAPDAPDVPATPNTPPVNPAAPPMPPTSPTPATPTPPPKMTEPAVMPEVTPAPASIPDASPEPTATKSETIEDQNIFFMLGVDNGIEELKDNFLNELQQVIWDDFLENDVSLLITSDEKVKFDEIMTKKDSGKDSEAIQDALVAYLETLIPDLEDIMLEKALDLKADLYVERISSMKEYHAGNSDNLEKISTAEKMMNEDKWYSSAELLNELETK